MGIRVASLVDVQIMSLQGKSHSPTSCPLSRLPVGGRGVVYRVEGERDVRRRLLEMGFCNGAIVQVVRKAPLGDPIEYELRGYHLSLRAEQARLVQVHPQDG